MIEYSPNPWSDPGLYSIWGSIMCAFAFCTLTMYTRDKAEWERYFGNMVSKWILHVGWISLFITYGLSSYFAYRALTYQANVKQSTLAKTDLNHLVGIIAVNIILNCIYCLSFYHFKHSLSGLLATLTLIFTVGYQAGITSKWGNYDEDVEERRPTNLKGATWLLLPYFFLISMAGLVMYLSINSVDPNATITFK